MDKIDYGNLYFKFLSNTLEVSQEKDSVIGAESQRVYSLIPYSHQYDNDAGICKQLSILHATLFLESKTLKTFTKSFSKVLKDLKLNKFLPANLNSIITPNTLVKYSEQSKFLRGNELSEDIMSYAKTLKDGQKASMLFSIGGHVLNLAMVSHDESITFTFYDPYTGQIYKQTVTRSDLEGEGKFTHPLSILNEHNVLLGKAAIKEDTLLDTTIPLILRTIISTDKNLDVEQKIEISESLQSSQVIEYLAQAPATFSVMFYIVSNSAFKAFLGQYGDLIVDKINNVLHCSTAISKCSNYFKDILGPVFLPATSKSLNVQDKIKSNYNHEYEYYSKDIPVTDMSQIFSKEDDVCIKDVSSSGLQDLALRRFNKVVLNDKKVVNDMLQKCFEQQKNGKIKVDKNTCSKFTNANQAAFSETLDAYYNYMDNQYKPGYQESCYITENLNDYLVPSSINDEL